MKWRKRSGITHEAEQILTKEFLHSVFSYEDGNIVWKVDRLANKCKGKVAGTKDNFGHLNVTLGGIVFKVHRLVWIMHNGGPCEHDIDHINRNPSDNRIENLRKTNDISNQQNRNYRKKSRCGFRGVYFRKKYSTYQASITVNRERIYLGCYRTAIEASIAYETAAKKFFNDFYPGEECR